MKYLLILLLSLITFNSNSQALRYFHFSGRDCGHGEWRDTVFTAATSDPAFIDTILAEINKPIGNRRFIAGPIDYGNGGFNYNAFHSFQWHHIPNQWFLAEAAIEICDGCPHSDLDQNTAYFIDTVGTYCPWGGVPLREVQIPTSTEARLEAFIKMYPNPTDEYLYIEFFGKEDYSVEVFSLHSNRVEISRNAANKHQLDISELKPGVYIVKIETENAFAHKKLIVK